VTFVCEVHGLPRRQTERDSAREVTKKWFRLFFYILKRAWCVVRD